MLMMAITSRLSARARDCVSVSGDWPTRARWALLLRNGSPSLERGDLIAEEANRRVAQVDGMNEGQGIWRSGEATGERWVELATMFSRPGVI